MHVLQAPSSTQSTWAPPVGLPGLLAFFSYWTSEGSVGSTRRVTCQEWAAEEKLTAGSYW